MKKKGQLVKQSFTELGFQGKLRGLVPGFLGWAASSGQPRGTRLGSSRLEARVQLSLGLALTPVLRHRVSHEKVTLMPFSVARLPG